jgi:hypothetical protein
MGSRFSSKSDDSPLPARAVYCRKARTSIRTLSLTEWQQWSEREEELPITCRPDWARAVAAHGASHFKVTPRLVCTANSESLAVTYETGPRIGSRITLSPFGLYAAAYERKGSASAPEGLDALTRMAGITSRSIEYVQPFYWAADTAAPRRSNIRPRGSTHVLRLDQSYDDLFVRVFAGPTRTCIRRAEQEQVRVEFGGDQRTMAAYYRLHESLASLKGGYGPLHPAPMLRAMVSSSPAAELGVAYVGDELAAGGIFLDDGPSVFYWHAAADRQFARQQPAYALLSQAIRRAITRRKCYFNFGGSAGISSLIKFKESWGAVELPLVGYMTEHALLVSARRVRSFLRRHASLPVQGA